MPWNKYKYIYMGLLIVFLASGALSFYLAYKPDPQEKPEMQITKPMENSGFKITEDTQIEYSQDYRVCRKYNLNCGLFPLVVDDGERDQIVNLTVEEIKTIYPEEHWLIETKNQNNLLIIKKNQGLCPNHKKVWHLGENRNKDYIAIYYGPKIVGVDGGIARVTEIPIKNLPTGYQEKIRNHAIEFYQEDEMIATLDSLSEFLN
ncbi:MAG: hypothetical protein GX923_07050 [Clostridia bacterium]|jgi:hypothetical protein|nr:hypothetical protein [Clostridia bacterium]